MPGPRSSNQSEICSSFHPVARDWPRCTYGASITLADGHRIDLVLPPGPPADPSRPRVASDGGTRVEVQVRAVAGESSFDETISFYLPPGAELVDLSAGPEFDIGDLPGFRIHPVPFKVGLDGLDRSRDLASADPFTDYAEGWILEDGIRGCLAMRLPSPDAETCFVPLAIREANGRRLLQIGSVGPDGEDHRLRSPYLDRPFPQDCVTLPVTRFAFFNGGWEEGVRLFRRVLGDALAERLETYRPLPVTYNTYHDFGPSYSRADLLTAMKRVREVGAGLIHLDPGWETVWGSAVWDERRLGSPEEFVAEAASYDLKVGCWTSFHTTDPDVAQGCYATGPDCARYVAEDFGEVKLYGVCPSSRWAETFRDNVGHLIRAGFVFVNSDFHDWPWPGWSCHDPSHGHAVPLSRAGWTGALNDIFAQLHGCGIPVTVEMHDHVESGEYRTPIWYLYSRPGSYDEKWAYEFMWKTHEDLLTRKLFALYHLRKAEPVPLFLHMNMISDNANALAFWYVASCVHHIGVGGALKAPEEVFQGYRRAIALYKEHFEEFTQGQFVGIDELSHLHIHPDRRSGVLLCFNLEDTPVERNVELDLRADAPDITGGRLVTGVPLISAEGGWGLRVPVAAKDVSVVPLNFSA